MKALNLKFIISNFMKSPLFSGSLITIIGLNGVNLINYLYHFLMVKLLKDPAQYGELVALISLMGLLGIIPGSFNLVVIKYISAAKDDKEIKALIDWFKNKVLMISLVIFFLILLFSPLISSFLHFSNSWYVMIIGLSFLFSLPALLNRSILQGLLKFKEMIISVTAENALKLIIGAILVYLGFNVGGAIVGLVLAIIIGWYLSKIYLTGYYQQSPAVSIDIKPMIKYALPVAVYSFATTSLYSSDIVLVKHFFSSHDAGLYAALSTLAKMIFFGAGPIGAVMFPMVSRRHSRGEDYKRVFLYSFFASLFFALFVLALFWLFPLFIITLLFKSSYYEVKDLLVWFGIFITLFTLSSLIVTYGLSLNRTKVVLFPLVAAISQIILIYIFHQTLFQIILISILVTALLLSCLLIYSSYGKRLSKPNKINFFNRPGL